MQKILYICVVGFTMAIVGSLYSCKNDFSKTSKDDFSFVFMTDIHLEPKGQACEGFQKAMDTINFINPDFVITGGDLIMDALGQNFSTADSLYKLYMELIKNLKMPVYNTMGNHEIYGLYSNTDSVSENPEYAEKMFEKRLGKSYYSFMHKGWKFIVINSVEDTRKHSYIGWIDSAQIKWIKQELVLTSKITPVVLSTHIPFLTAFTQKYYGSTLKNDSSLVVANSKEVLDLFANHNLKLVLQGHLHTSEDIYIDGIHFITGGAISGGWWQGPHMGCEEGFVKVSIKENYFTSEYVDYGWSAID